MTESKWARGGNERERDRERERGRVRQREEERTERRRENREKRETVFFVCSKCLYLLTEFAAALGHNIMQS